MPPNQVKLVAPNSLPHIKAKGGIALSFWKSQVRSRISAITLKAAVRVPQRTTRK